MNKFQPISFKNINGLLSYLPDEELKIVEALRTLILECIPDVKEKLAYNVPFYSRHSRICFIWPASVPWGKTVKTGVEFGFCKAHLLPNPSYLNKGNRKEVYIKTFRTLKEIDAEIMRQLLYEAVLVDKETALVKKSKRQNR